uniref:Uncharacterized protein n=1 Tax=Trichobilharzia regenti TaxID=157069 RepID=A0AA85ITZ4_TRIRE|nr:unnamed protein product [Trichobilharzia regenti]
MLSCFTASNGPEVDSRILHLLHLCLHGGLYSCFFISDHEYSFTACSPASSNGRIGSFLEFDYEIKGLELIIAVRIQLNMPRSTFDSATGEFYILFDLVSE